MTYLKPTLSGWIGIALLASLWACQPKEGPAEQAGKSVDQAVDKAGQKIEKAGEKIQDTAKGEPKKP
jgi:hypothetical protein